VACCCGAGGGTEAVGGGGGEDGGAAQEASARAARDGSRKPAGRIARGREYAVFIGAILYEPAPPPAPWPAGGGGGTDKRAGVAVLLQGSPRRTGGAAAASWSSPRARWGRGHPPFFAANCSERGHRVDRPAQPLRARARMIGIDIPSSRAAGLRRVNSGWGYRPSAGGRSRTLAQSPWLRCSRTVEYSLMTPE